MQNHYLDKRSTFMEPEVNQYGGQHMVMTNVMKEVKTKYVNLDTRFSRDLPQPVVGALNVPGNYTFDFAERIQKARSISVATTEIPLSYYNVSQQLENNTFIVILNNNDSNPYTFTIPDGIYGWSDVSNASITSAINTALSGIPDVSGVVQFVLTDSNFKTSIQIEFINDVTDVEIILAAKNALCTKSVTAGDRYNLKSRLGWMLGFRQPQYKITITGPPGSTAIIPAEAIIDLNGPRYLFLAVDEFSNHAPQSSFVSMLPKSLLNRNILARISVQSQNYLPALNIPVTFGTIQVATLMEGLLLTDTREYTDDIDLQRLNVQLVDEYGRNVHLNGLDFSFTLVVKHT